MKILFTKLMTLAVVAMAMVSCNKTDIDESVNKTEGAGEGAVLYVSDLSSRIGFEDNGTSGISLTWEEGDQFTLFDAEGNKVDDFECSDLESKLFTSVTATTELVADASYTAFYPATEEETIEEAKATINPSAQNGDLISDLDEACYMLADFTYSSESQNSVTFIHQMAIMTFKFESADNTPAKLIFVNGNSTYTVNYSEALTEADGLYTSHIMIYPCEAEVRNLVFELYTSEGTVNAKKTTVSSREYVAGMRYSATLSNYSTPTKFSGGAGTLASPYLISTNADMRELSTDVNDSQLTYSGSYFTVTNDIDLGGEEDEFTAIGRSSGISFQGTFDGDNHAITGLYIYSETGKYQGLFGYTNKANIKNLTVEGSVTASTYVGGIVGYSSSIYSYITNCHSNVEVTALYSGDCYAGGIVGNSSSYITNCYNTAKVSGYTEIGGIAGNSTGEINNCYNTAEISGSGSSMYIGGILGRNSSGYIANCYFNSDNCSYYAIGYQYYTKNQYNVLRKNTQEMQDDEFLLLLNNNAYEYNKDNSTKEQACAWVKGSDNYPVLDINKTPTYTSVTYFSGGTGVSSDPYLISTSDDLRQLSDDVNSGMYYKGEYFKITSDINLGGIDSDGVITETNEFTAIGSYSKYPFCGIFDGDGHTISGIYINKSSTNSQGLFGYIEGASIMNLTVEGSVKGKSYVGGIVAYATSANRDTGARSYITNCHNAATIIGGDNRVGGICGYSIYSYLTNCSNEGDIQANGASSYSYSIGGILGQSEYGQITNCYSVGAMKYSTGGGVIGYIESTSTYSAYNCYWAKDIADSKVTSAFGPSCSGSYHSSTDMTSTAMQEQVFVDELNANAAAYNATYSDNYPACAWKLVEGGFPTLNFGVTPTAAAE